MKRKQWRSTSPIASTLPFKSEFPSKLRTYVTRVSKSLTIATGSEMAMGNDLAFNLRANRLPYFTQIVNIFDDIICQVLR